MGKTTYRKVNYQLASSSSSRKNCYEEDWGNKTLNLSRFTPFFSKFWTMVDPNRWNDTEDGQFRFEYVPVMTPPDHIELSNLKDYGCVGFSSKVYFVGGVLQSPDDPPLYFSDRVFSYDTKAKSWDELEACLNISRAWPTVLVIENVMYVMGGYSIDYSRDMNPDNWIEFYDLSANNKTKTWKLLPTRVPDDVIRYSHNGYNLGSAAVYERDSKIFFFSAHEVYSFDYANNTWSTRDVVLNNHRQCFFHHVAIIGDILFTAYRSYIYGYDLCENKTVLQYSLEETCAYSTDLLYLFRVSKDALLLCFDGRLIPGDYGCQLSPDEFRLKDYISIGHLCFLKFRVDDSSGIRLVLEGASFFPSHNVGIFDPVLV